MNITKWLMCVFLGIGLTMPLADILSTNARADENEETAEARSEVRGDRVDRHNRQWRLAKQRSRFTGRRGNPNEVLKQLKRDLKSRDIVVTVCIINVIAKAEKLVAAGGEASQVVRLINRANCEIQ